MADIKDYGELYTSDILVVGGGMAGLVTAIRAKENDPTLDILVIDYRMEWTGYKSRKRNPFHIQTSEWCKKCTGISGACTYPVLKRPGVPERLSRISQR